MLLRKLCKKASRVHAENCIQERRKSIMVLLRKNEAKFMFYYPPILWLPPTLRILQEITITTTKRCVRIRRFTFFCGNHRTTLYASNRPAGFPYFLNKNIRNRYKQLYLQKHWTFYAFSLFILIVFLNH